MKAASRAAPRIVRLLAVATMATACSGSEEPAGAAEQPSVFATGADQVMLGVEHYISREGIRRGVLHADTAYTYDDASRIEMRQLEVRFFDDAGADLGLLTAQRGDYELRDGDMTVRGDVRLLGRLQAAAPSVLETDSLAYDAVRDELSTDASWTLTHPDGTVEQGRGLVTDPSLQNIQKHNWTVTTPDVEVPQ